MSLVSKLPINKFCFVSTTTATAKNTVVHLLHVSNVHARNCKAPCSEGFCAPHLKRRSSLCNLLHFACARILFSTI